MLNPYLKSGDKKISYKRFSTSLKYLADEKKLADSLDNLEKIFNIHLSDLNKKNFLSKNGSEIIVAKPDGKPDEVVIHKVKSDDKFSADYFRNHLSGFINTFEKSQVNYLHIFIPEYSIFKNFFPSEEYYYQTFIEGVLYGSYSFDLYKTEKKNIKDLTVYFYASDASKLKKALNTTENLMKGVFFARNLQNEPANILTPEILAERISSTLSKEEIKIKVLNEKEIKKRKMGGLYAVGSGSKNSPRFIIIEYSAKIKKKKSPKIALVGKGVTFDTGGISIKPANDMWEMKADMSGAAVVAGTILAAAKEQIPVDILGVIPAAENMLSGNAMRPGDIVKTASGKTIEVDNTDAEGRMILSDALDYASKEKPDVIIDLATLTGACVVALGEFVAGLFTRNEKLSKELYDIGLQTYDRVWPLPLWDDYNSLNKSEVADVKNLGGRWGGAISAAKFLENFVDKKIPWVHIDIAGPTGIHNTNNYSKKYMNAFGVRLLFEYLKKQ